jgi:hypothetical protein
VPGAAAQEAVDGIADAVEDQVQADEALDPVSGLRPRSSASRSTYRLIWYRCAVDSGMVAMAMGAMARMA